MVFESHETLGKLRQRLCEAVTNAPFGAMVGWRTPGGEVYGVVVGTEGKELLCLTTYDKTMRKDKGLGYYKDEAASDKLPQVTPTVRMSLQRVPTTKAFKHGRLQGSALKPSQQAAAALQVEGIEETHGTKRRSNGMNFTETNKRLDAILEALGRPGAGHEESRVPEFDHACTKAKEAVGEAFKPLRKKHPDEFAKVHKFYSDAIDALARAQYKLRH